MLKNRMRVISLFLLTIFFALANSKIVLAASTCIVNGQDVPCEELGDSMMGYFGWGIGLILFMFAIGIWATVFWIMMIIHAAKHDIEDRGMWIIVMVFTGIIGAVIYYFVVKKKFNKQSAASIPTIPASPQTPTSTPPTPPPMG